MYDAHVSHFYNVFLRRPASSIPKGSQWAVVFGDIGADIFNAIDLAYKGEPDQAYWKTREAATALLNKQLDETGCLYCQAIDLPGEGSTPIAEGNIKYNSYIRSYVGAGRNDFPLMRMSFLETNVSFADTILRGWALATAKFGMISREGTDKNYRTNMDCYRYVVTPTGPQIKSKIHFKGVCCISVDNQELNYDPLTIAVKRNAQFLYHSYSYDAVNNVPSELIS